MQFFLMTWKKVLHYHPLFKAAAEAVEESILNALVSAEHIAVGRDGHSRRGLADLLSDLGVGRN